MWFQRPEDAITGYEAAGKGRTRGSGPGGGWTYRARAVAGVLGALVLLGFLGWLGGFWREPVPVEAAPVPFQELRLLDHGGAEVVWTDTRACVEPTRPEVEVDATADPVVVTLRVLEVDRAPCTDPTEEVVRTMTVTLPAEARGRVYVDGACETRRWMGHPDCYEPNRG